MAMSSLMVARLLVLQEERLGHTIGLPTVLHAANENGAIGHTTAPVEMQVETAQAEDREQQIFEMSLRRELQGDVDW